MAGSAKITSKHQITLPADLRRTLGVAAGDRIDFVENASGVFEIHARKGRFEDLRGIVKLDHPVSTDEILTWVKQAREAGASDDRD